MTMNLRSITLLISVIVALCSCNEKIKYTNIADSDWVEALDTEEFKPTICSDWENYIPTNGVENEFSTKYIRLNFHIMRKSDGTHNFDEVEGEKFIKNIIRASNGYLRDNQQMNLPLNNQTPVHPTNIQYELQKDPDNPEKLAIYYHDDDQLYYMLAKGRKRNNYSKDVFNKYGCDQDTVLNVFVMALNADSTASKTYKPKASGISFGNWVKVSGWYYDARDTVLINGKKKTPKNEWFSCKNLIHEIGHSLGLKHTWRSNDGCTDTPMNPNCWNRSKQAPCDSLWSNNVMDYNSRKNAWSPCQIGKIHHNIAQKDKVRSLIKKTWCALDTLKNVRIKTEVVWSGSRDLEGNLIIEQGGKLEIRCGLSMPENSYIELRPGGELLINGARIYNDCGKSWKGIRKLKKGGEIGKLTITRDSILESVT